MRYETSAGGVIVAYKGKGKIPYVLLLKDKSRKWTFPKGLIEKNEVHENTAKREIAEEVGVKKLTLLAELAPIEYFYKWEGKLVKKKVFYYLFKNGMEEKLRPQRSEGIMDVKWFPFTKAVEVVGYKKTNKKILREAKEKLSNWELSNDKF